MHLPTVLADLDQQLTRVGGFPEGCDILQYSWLGTGEQRGTHLLQPLKNHGCGGMAGGD